MPYPLRVAHVVYRSRHTLFVQKMVAMKQIKDTITIVTGGGSGM